MRSATRKKTGKDKAYLEWIRGLPCTACILPWKYYVSGISYSNVQKYQTEAAHVGDRGLSQKCPDRETIPLCAEHHRLGRFSAHRMGKKFWEHYGIEKDVLISALNRAFEER